MSIIRILLICLVVYLFVSPFFRRGTKAPQKKTQEENTIKFVGKKISKNTGEYVDYEEVKEDGRKAD